MVYRSARTDISPRANNNSPLLGYNSPSASDVSGLIYIDCIIKTSKQLDTVELCNVHTTTADEKNDFQFLTECYYLRSIKIQIRMQQYLRDGKVHSYIDDDENKEEVQSSDHQQRLLQQHVLGKRVAQLYTSITYAKI